jgi:hypothetical protein
MWDSIDEEDRTDIMDNLDQSDKLAPPGHVSSTRGHITFTRFVCPKGGMEGVVTCDRGGREGPVTIPFGTCCPCSPRGEGVAGGVELRSVVRR